MTSIHSNVSSTAPSVTRQPPPGGESPAQGPLSDAWDPSELSAAYNEPAFNRSIEMMPLDGEATVPASNPNADAASSRAASLAHAASEAGATDNAGASGALSGVAAGAPVARANRNRRRLLWGIGIGVVAVVIIAVGAGVAAGSKKHPSSSGSSTSTPPSIVPTVPTLTTSSSVIATATSTAVPVPNPTSNLAQFAGTYRLTATLLPQGGSNTTCGPTQLVGCNPGFVDNAVIAFSDGELSLAPFVNDTNAVYAGTYHPADGSFMFPDPPAVGNTTEGTCIVGATQKISIGFFTGGTFAGINLDTYDAKSAGCMSNSCACEYDWNAVKIS